MSTVAMGSRNRLPFLRQTDAWANLAFPLYKLGFARILPRPVCEGRIWVVKTPPRKVSRGF